VSAYLGLAATVGALACAAWLAACAAGPAVPPADVPLFETSWRAVELGGEPVESDGAERAPRLVLSAEQGNRVQGTTGCNGFAGPFERSGDRLDFGVLATTRMACQPPVDEVEYVFLRALEETVSYRLHGETLELLDANGRVRARFEASPR
jgi:heat shock protein HslJ